MATKETELVSRLMEPATRERAFAELVRQYQEPLYWKIRHFIFSHEDANDVLQNTFLKAWTHMDQFRNESKLTTWLHRIAVNESLDFLRRQKKTTVAGSEAVASLSERLMADQYFNGDRAQALLLEAVSTLPEVQRMVFTLRYFDDMHYAEMSQLLHTTEGALKASYHLAVKKITTFIQNHQDD